MALPQEKPKAPPPPERQIALYTSRGEISEAKGRFKAALKIKDAQDHEYSALAHLCLKWGLDPFNGEAYIIPGNGVMIGIKGLRKMANRQAQRLGVRWWIEFHDIRSDVEKKEYGIPDNAIHAVICHLRRSDQLQAYTETLMMLQKAGNLPFDQIVQILGKPPVVVGIGYIKPGESSKMPFPQLCRKRAETHAIKQAWDVEDVSEGDVVGGRVADAEWVEADYEYELETVEPVAEANSDDESEGRQDAPQPDIRVVPPASPVAPVAPPKPSDPSRVWTDLRQQNPASMGAACSLINGARKQAGLSVLSEHQIRAFTAAEKSIKPEDVRANEHWLAMVSAAEKAAKS